MNDALSSYIEPNISDFNALMYPTMPVSYLFANRAYRAYLKGDASSTNIDLFQSSVSTAWTKANQAGKNYYIKKFTFT